MTWPPKFSLGEAFAQAIQQEYRLDTLAKWEEHRPCGLSPAGEQLARDAERYLAFWEAARECRCRPFAWHPECPVHGKRAA